ncbi:hypothetical protein, conserved [Trypanosoma brucei gambiense DAL972]|uniref:Uncharacterized protein n=1 Tax=Trypanosoma brucei gambiense (strain MHOM/CI/86/DAL972) TaxID=679716 RepID=D0A258_TRYB9|nr:hypothetical protein, conserved [Trypanosoma brucei gambiense DAL972]CBH15352.1 hypothetical protein, conserved [Trypanosoma brucei gambiense DAL972]|eukprot:XP_011777616.1 hypothetical protein, conserved [Trypanosoma brucei gambiense DAL972]
MLFTCSSRRLVGRTLTLYLLRRNCSALTASVPRTVPSDESVATSGGRIVSATPAPNLARKETQRKQVRRSKPSTAATAKGESTGEEGTESVEHILSLVSASQVRACSESHEPEVSSSFAASPQTPVTQALQLHRRLASEKQQPHIGIGETTVSSSASISSERVERRRKKWTVAESEFDAGITERLLPEIRRLAALHELHYGDAVMREVDSSTYFASLGGATASVADMRADDDINDADLTDDEFLKFEAEQVEVAGDPVLYNTSSSGIIEKCQKKEEITNAANGEEKVCAHSLQTPWFVPAGGVVRLEPLPPEDVLCLLKFLMHLRQQTLDQLPVPLQAKVSATERVLRSVHQEEKSKEILIVPRAVADGGTTCISFEDVMVYLDKAPSPILGFTEDLPPGESPAFVFVLYTENVSLQNAIGHMSALFEIPQRAFLTCTAVSKMSCGAVLCAVTPNQVRREHLLLLNTMRHPGFVIRVGSIQEVKDAERIASLFGDLARWQPLHEVEVLLRRVSCRSRQELEHRLRAIKEVGAVFFCSNREASLVRAATDLLHGFYRSALLSALHRRHAPLELRQFIKRPNVITAARARRASTDPTIRQALKNYELTQGNWEQTVARIPYVWRRRWLNALRSSVWNVMASRRLSLDGASRRVIPGDIVFRPEYRADVHRRMIPTVKAEHVMVVRDEEEAALCSVEDICIPFLRGTYPPELFAPEETKHPIMTNTSMLAILRELHAPQLLLGMNDACRQLMDIRCDCAPLLFRRLIIRPIAVSFTVLEDKPPVKSVHFDAARLLLNDRLMHQNALRRNPLQKSDPPKRCGVGADGEASLPSCSSLANQDVVLDQTTIGARLMSGVLAEEFFTTPDRSDYVTLGHVTRKLHGNFVAAAPQTPEDALGPVDRLYSVYIHAVLRYGVGAMSQLLREYFILGGIEAESDSALQHKVHRMRRELDNETQYLTAPTFCSACYSRCHDALNSCAEYQHKHGKHLGRKRREETLQQLQFMGKTLPSVADTSPLSSREAATVPGGGEISAVSGVNGSAVETQQTTKGVTNEPHTQLELELLLRRRNGEQKWGVHLTSSLCLANIDDVSVVAGGRLRCVCGDVTSAISQKQLCRVLLQGGVEDISSTSNEINKHHMLALRRFVAVSTGENVDTIYESSNKTWDNGCEAASILDENSDGVKLTKVAEVFSVSSPRHPQTLTTESREEIDTVVGDSRTLLHNCRWALKGINDAEVADRKQVAAVFVSIGKQREVRLRFRTIIDLPLSHINEHGNDSNNAGGTERCELPAVAELTLSIAEGNGSFGKSGWGVMIDKSSLALLNLSDLLHQRQVGVSGRLNPPIPSYINPSAADGMYVLHALDGIPVASQQEVSLHMGKRRQALKGVSNGKCSSLRLQLRRLQGHPQKGVATVETAKLPGATMKTIVAAGVEADGKRDKVTTVVNSTTTVEDVSDAAESESGLTPLLPCSPQCVPLTSVQLRRSVFTIAINRSAGAPPGRWGIRVQRGTRRLQYIQHNQYFTFQVYTAKQNQAVRIADNLRLHTHQRKSSGTSEPDDGTVASETEEKERTTAASFSYFIYMIAGVNYRHVGNNEELRASLTEAGRSHEESVILHVQQYRLAYIALSVKRKEVAGGGALEPVGLCISKDMVIKSVVAGSAVARAIIAATHEDCSLRGLIVEDSSSSGGNFSSPNQTWRFDLDEDEEGQHIQTNSPVGDAGARNVPGNSNSDAVLGRRVAHWNMVDGVALCATHDKVESSAGGESRNRFVWRILYAARAGPLRTPQDVARTFASNIQEDTIFVQQCVMDD